MYGMNTEMSVTDSCICHVEYVSHQYFPASCFILLLMYSSTPSSSVAPELESAPTSPPLHTSLGIAPIRCEVDVIDPEKKVSQSDALAQNYITYKVASKQIFAPSMDSIDGTERVLQSCVLRRFSDFVWLQSALTLDISDALIPALPPGSIMNRFEPDFVEQRRRALALFMQRCMTHSLIARHSLLQVFLTGTDNELLAARKLHDSQHVKTPATTAKRSVNSSLFSHQRSMLVSFSTDIPFLFLPVLNICF
jgi:hypothetical protein